MVEGKPEDDIEWELEPDAQIPRLIKFRTKITDDDGEFDFILSDFPSLWRDKQKEEKELNEGEEEEEDEGFGDFKFYLQTVTDAMVDGLKDQKAYFDNLYYKGQIDKSVRHADSFKVVKHKPLEFFF